MRLPIRLIVIAALVLAGCAPPTPFAAPVTEPAATPTASATTQSSDTPSPSRTPTVTEVPSATATQNGFVSLGSYSMFYRCAGEGEPTVIIETGFLEPGTSGSWGRVIMDVKRATRICTYDRINLGESADLAGTRTSEAIARDLHTMLDHAGVYPPYVLVGHSLGGWHVRMFAHMYAEDVAGMMLIDASHPDQLDTLLAVLPAPSTGEARSITQARDNWSDPNGMMNNTELFDFETSADQVRQTGPFGDLPLYVLTRDPDIETGALPHDLHVQVERTWQSLQADLATLSTHSTHLIVEGAGHGVHQDRPMAVIEAMLGLIAASRE